jgi:hypothetical protein
LGIGDWGLGIVNGGCNSQGLSSLRAWNSFRARRRVRFLRRPTFTIVGRFSCCRTSALSGPSSGLRQESRAKDESRPKLHRGDLPAASSARCSDERRRFGADCRDRQDSIGGAFLGVPSCGGIRSRPPGHGATRRRTPACNGPVLCRVLRTGTRTRVGGEGYRRGHTKAPVGICENGRRHPAISRPSTLSLVEVIRPRRARS